MGFENVKLKNPSAIWIDNNTMPDYYIPGYSFAGIETMQSRVSICLSFENQGISPVGDDAQVTEYLHKQSRTLQQTR